MKRKILLIVLCIELCCLAALWIPAVLAPKSLSNMTEEQCVAWIDEYNITPSKDLGHAALGKLIQETIIRVELWPEFPWGLTKIKEDHGRFVAEIRWAVLKHHGWEDTWEHAHYRGHYGKYPPTE